MGALTGDKVAFLVANEGVEQVELTEPWEAVEEAEGTPVLVAPKTGAVQAFDHLDKADVFEATVAAGDADVADYADTRDLPGVDRDTIDITVATIPPAIDGPQATGTRCDIA